MAEGLTVTSTPGDQFDAMNEAAAHLAETTADAIIAATETTPDPSHSAHARDLSIESVSSSPHSRRSKIAEWLWRVLLLSFVVLLTVVVSHYYFAEPKWDPLGRYPLQTVNNPGHVVGFDRPVSVTGTKCADETVKVSGQYSWVSETPPGFILSVGNAVATRTKGCTTSTFENPQPASVRTRVRQLCAEKKINLWVLTGGEVPSDDNGNVGVEHVWRTQPFQIGCPT